MSLPELKNHEVLKILLDKLIEAISEKNYTKITEICYNLEIFRQILYFKENFPTIKDFYINSEN